MSSNRKGNNNDDNNWDLDGLPKPKTENPGRRPNDDFTVDRFNNYGHVQRGFGSEAEQIARMNEYYNATKRGKRVSVFSRIKWQFNKFRDELRRQFEDLRDQYEAENLSYYPNKHGLHKRLHIAKKVASIGLAIVAFGNVCFELYLKEIRDTSEFYVKYAKYQLKMYREEQGEQEEQREQGEQDKQTVSFRERLAVLLPNGIEIGEIPMHNVIAPTIQILNEIFDENGNVKGNIPAGTTLIQKDNTGNYSEFVLKNDKENLRIISLFVVNNERKNS